MIETIFYVLKTYYSFICALAAANKFEPISDKALEFVVTKEKRNASCCEQAFHFTSYPQNVVAIGQTRKLIDLVNVLDIGVGKEVGIIQFSDQGPLQTNQVKQVGIYCLETEI